MIDSTLFERQKHGTPIGRRLTRGCVQRFMSTFENSNPVVETIEGAVNTRRNLQQVVPIRISIETHSLAIAPEPPSGVRCILYSLKFGLVGTKKIYTNIIPVLSVVILEGNLNQAASLVTAIFCLSGGVGNELGHVVKTT